MITIIYLYRAVPASHTDPFICRVILPMTYHDIGEKVLVRCVKVFCNDAPYISPTQMNDGIVCSEPKSKSPGYKGKCQLGLSCAYEDAFGFSQRAHVTMS